MIRSLQVTDASRDARVQMIGARAEEPAPSGRLEKAALYREAVEAELDSAPLAAKSERDLVTENVHTIGQIFTNYQAALHQFEAAVESGAGEAVPRELARDVLREAARDVFEPVLAAAAETAGEVVDHVAEGKGVADSWPAEQPREPGASAPAFALRNLVVAERRRIAATQMRLLKAQVSFAAAAEDRAAVGGPGYRTRLLGANMDLNGIEQKTHSAEGIFKTLMDRYKEAAKGRAEVRIVIDPRVARRARAHHRPAREQARGPAAVRARRLVQPQRPPPGAPRHLGAAGARRLRGADRRDGRPRLFDRNEKGGQYFDEFQQRLRSGGLPHTHVLTGG